MSNSVRPHRRQPTRLPHPWDSPGKNTGVGCHFLLQCMKVKSESEVAQSCPTPSDPWTAAYQASSSMGFSRQEYRSGVLLPSLDNLHSPLLLSQLTFLSPPLKKKNTQMASLMNSTKHLRKKQCQFYMNPYRKLKRKKCFPAHSMRPELS